MRTFLVFFLLLLAFSCENEHSIPKYIELSENDILFAPSEAEIKLTVSSNCDWGIRDVPQWCKADKQTDGTKTFLVLTVSPNDTEIERKAEIEITDGTIMACLHVAQEGITYHSSSIKWHTFPMNSLQLAGTKISENGIDSIYTLKGKSIFANAQILSKIFAGNLICNQLKSPTELIDYPRFSYNPVTFFSFIGSDLFDTTSIPSKTSYDQQERLMQSNPI